MAEKGTLESFLKSLLTAEEILAREKEKKEKRAFKHFEENLQSFVIAIESMLQSVQPFLNEDDILGGLPGKEFVIDIYANIEDKWTLTLKLSNDGKKWTGWPFPGGMDTFSPVGYSLTVECSFNGGKLYEDIISSSTDASIFIKPGLVSPRLGNMILEHSGLEMTGKIFLIFDLQKEIYGFFRGLLVQKSGVQITDYVFSINQKLNYLVRQFAHTHRNFLVNQKVVQSFQCLVFETARDLKDTKSFIKSKRLAQIREGLEKRAREIVAEVNK